MDLWTVDTQNLKGEWTKHEWRFETREEAAIAAQAAIELSGFKGVAVVYCGDGDIPEEQPTMQTFIQGCFVRHANKIAGGGIVGGHILPHLAEEKVTIIIQGEGECDSPLDNEQQLFAALRTMYPHWRGSHAVVEKYPGMHYAPYQLLWGYPELVSIFVYQVPIQ